MFRRTIINRSYSDILSTVSVLHKRLVNSFDSCATTFYAFTMEEPITNTFFIHIILNVGFVQYPPAYSLNTLSMNSVKIKSSKDYVFTRSVLTMTQK